MASRVIQHVICVVRKTNRVFPVPALPDDSPYMFQLIPKLSFSDPINHPVYFIVPSSRPAPRLFGISLIYPTHALVVLTHSLFFMPLTASLTALYPLCTSPTNPLVNNIYATLSCCEFEQTLITPPHGFVAALIKLMKLAVLPFRTIVYSTSADDVSRSLLFLMHSIPGVFLPASQTLQSLGFPLAVDTKRPIIPFLPATLLDCITGMPGFIIGTNSDVFAEPSPDWDVVVNIRTDRCLCSREIAAVLAETPQDRVLLVRFKELLLRNKVAEIMNLIAGYYIGLLRSLLPFYDAPNPANVPSFPQSHAADYGAAFVRQFVATDIYAAWKDAVNRDEAMKIPACHPCHASEDTKAANALRVFTATVVPDWMIDASVLATTHYEQFSLWRSPAQ